jgi:hypothetical protein
MCKHEEVLTTARNALVALRHSLLGKLTPEVNEELSRLENFYDWDRFENEDYECTLCNIAEYDLVEEYGHDVWYGQMSLWDRERERERRVTWWRASLGDEAVTWGKVTSL